MDRSSWVDKTVAKWVDQAMQEGKLELAPSKRCRVCKDPVIMQLVNKMLSRAFSVSDILDVLESHNLKLKSDRQPQITKSCLINHRRSHFDVQSPAGAILRRIQEASAANYGQDWETGVGTILNAASYYQTMMIKGYETLIDSKTVVSPTDGAWAAARLHELLRKDEEAYDRARMLAQYGRMVEVMRKFTREEDWPEIQAILRGEQVVEVQDPAEAPQMVAIDDSPDPEEY
jgi:hypothetical protein